MKNIKFFKRIVRWFDSWKLSQVLFFAFFLFLIQGLLIIELHKKEKIINQQQEIIDKLDLTVDKLINE